MVQRMDCGERLFFPGPVNDPGVDTRALPAGAAAATVPRGFASSMPRAPRAAGPV